MKIKNPRRILAIGAPNSGILNLLKELTGSAPTQTSDTTAGLTHDWDLETKYYTATLPIWIDEILNTAEWREEFTKPEAGEVIRVLGAWIYCFKKPVDEKDLDTIKETIKAVTDVIERACGFGGDMVCLAVAMPQSTTPHLEKSPEEWDEITMEHGFEFVDFEAKGKNEFGEAMGVQRVREALEATEWESGADLDLEGDVEGFEGSFAAEEAEMNMELFGMKSALHEAERGQKEEEEDEEPSEQDVEQLEVMMRKMIAIKEIGESMEEEERKRFAVKALNDMLNDL